MHGGYLPVARRNGTGNRAASGPMSWSWLPLFDSAAAVHELLRASPWRAVQLLGTFFDLKSSTKLLVQRCSVISYDVKTAALRRSFGPEGTHDHVAAWFDGVEHGSHVGLALLLIG